MPIESLSCPMCGAAVTSDASLCAHCGARLATVACPKCFGMMFIGQEFCPHCGAKADRQESSAASKPEACPRCKTNLDAVVIGGSNLRECPYCEGIWTDKETLREICAQQERQAAVLGMATHLPSNENAEMENQIRYLPCPVCGQLMNRVNFAHCSNVIVDVCHEHGTWFDRDELRRIVEFIRNGGFEKERALEMSDLEEKRISASAAQISTDSGGSPMFDDDPRYGALSAVARTMMDILFR
ncbi:MAG TPA: zf-TFIIB domain-containing protein [Verrucomicrobiae bacterium]